MSTSDTQRRSYRQNPCAYMLLDETCKKKTPPPPVTLVKPDSDGSEASMEAAKSIAAQSRRAGSELDLDGEGAGVITGEFAYSRPGDLR